MAGSDSEGPVSLDIGFSDLAGNPGDNVTSTKDDSAVQFDRTSPVLQPVDNVTTPTSDNTSLSYTFSSTEAGTIRYGGDCDSDNDTALADNNTITFNALADGTYDNCTITVTDDATNTSDNLSVSSFTIDTTAPTLREVTPVTTPTNDNTSLSYIFSSTEAGTITYGGSCSSSTTSAAVGNNTVTLNALANGTYNNCRECPMIS